ncbi:MAG: Gfo/Idh/MocA family oxidoreductase, partial [Alphaproteobacteria bacterium]
AGFAVSDAETLWTDKDTDAVMVMTRHNAHAQQAMTALKANKHLWVEKPLALTLDDITKIEVLAEGSGRAVMVGFNRRFSPALTPLKTKLDMVSGPKQVLVRVNAGRLEEGGWQQSDEGGGRLLGEVCHFTDVCMWMIGREGVSLESVHAVQGAGQDDYVVTLRFSDGSVGTVFYSSEGDASQAKERVEVFGGGAIGVMDNYLTTTWAQGGRKRKLYGKPMLRGQEKGHKQALAAWLKACAGDEAAIPELGELCTSSRVVLWASRSIETGVTVAAD